MGLVACVNCGHENESGVGRCVKCGASLPVEEPSTAEINPSTAPVRAPVLPAAVLDMPDEAVIFYFLGSRKPLTIQPRPEITIGRAVMGESESVLDLTPYGAIEKGMSRHHAKIVFADNKYQLVDLNSTNGTWVNEQKLAPQELRVLRSTDMIRFGNLQLFVYFKPLGQDPKETASTSTQHIDRVDLVWPVENFTPAHLVNILGPFLEAIAKLQQLRNEVLSAENAKPVLLHSISVGPPISIEVEHATSALELAGLILATLRDEKLLGGGREAIQSPNRTGASGTRVDLTTKSLADSSEVEITRRHLIQIAHRTLDRLPAKLEEPDRTDYVIRMLAILQTLEKAELSIISVAQKS